MSESEEILLNILVEVQKYMMEKSLRRMISTKRERAIRRRRIVFFSSQCYGVLCVYM